MFRTFCEFATDYGEVLQRLKDPLGMRGADKIIQFPYVLPVCEWYDTLLRLLADEAG